MCKQYFVLVYGNIIFHSTGMKHTCFIFYLRYLHYLEIVEEGRGGGCFVYSSVNVEPDPLESA